MKIDVTRLLETMNNIIPPDNCDSIEIRLFKDGSGSVSYTVEHVDEPVYKATHSAKYTQYNVNRQL